MTYNISFDIVAFIVAILLTIVHAFIYNNKTQSNRFFQRYTEIVILTVFMDILTALTIDGVIKVSDTVNTYLNTFYLTCTIFASFTGYMAVVTKSNFKVKTCKTVGVAAIIGEVSCLIINIPTGIWFSFQQGEYIKGNLFYLNYAFPSIFIIMISIMLLACHKELEPKMAILPSAFMLFPIIGIAIQIRYPRILLSGFEMVLTGVVICFALETPDYEKLKQTVQELEESKERELESRIEAEGANKSKTEFLEKMSHELRTPINAVLGFNEMIFMHGCNGIIEDNAKRIGRAGKKLLSLVDDLIDFSQVETGRLEFRPTEYEIAWFAYDLQKKYDQQLEKTEKAFEIYVDETVPQRLYGDTNRIRQVLDCLINYYENRPEVRRILLYIKKVKLGRDTVDLSYAIRTPGNTETVEGLQHLIGTKSPITKKILESMESQFQVVSTTKDNYLSFEITQEMVDYKEVGDLEEAIKRYRNRHQSLRDAETFVMPDARILVVDDMPVNIKVFAGIISQFKVQLDSATSGSEAITLMRKKEYDLVFMDHQMPYMDGIETLKKIRSDESILSKNAVIIAFTANVTMGAKEIYLQEGFADYITKPVSKKKIINALLTHLPEKRKEDWVRVDVTGNDEDKKDATQVKKDPNRITGLDVELGVSNCMDNMDFYLDVLKEYGETDISKQLQEYYEASDWKNYRVLIHSIKSSSNIIGHMELSERAKELEAASAKEDTDYIMKHHEEWLELYQKIMSQIKELYEDDLYEL